MTWLVLLLCCGPVAILVCGFASIIVSRLANGLDLWRVRPIQGGSDEFSWAATNWLGLRNLGRIWALVPGYESMHWAAQPGLGAVGPRVALTIDDAVGRNSTGVGFLLDLLGQHRVPATFFTIANHDFTLDGERPEILRHMADRGHEIGNHGVEDAGMSAMSASEVQEVLAQWEDRVRKVVQTWPQRESDWKWFRPPLGAMSSTMTQVLADEGYSVALGDVLSGDWMIQDTEYHVDIIKSVTMDGSVIILHTPDRPERMHTLDILREVIPYLHSHGFTFVRLSELYRGDHRQDPSQSTCEPCLAVVRLGLFSLMGAFPLAICGALWLFARALRQRGWSMWPMCSLEHHEEPEPKYFKDPEYDDSQDLSSDSE